MTSETNETADQVSSNDKIIKKFSSERKYWTELITSMSQRLKNIYELADLQVDLYSQRQIAVDYTHELLTFISKLNSIYRSKKNDRWDYYTRNYDLRLDKEPKETKIAVDLSEIVERREHLQTHLDFMRETIRTIDTMCFGIKHRIQLEDYKRD